MNIQEARIMAQEAAQEAAFAAFGKANRAAADAAQAAAFVCDIIHYASATNRHVLIARHAARAARIAQNSEKHYSEKHWQLLRILHVLFALSL